MCDISAVKFQKAVNDFNGNLFESSLNLIGQVLLGLSRLVFKSLSKEILQLTQQQSLMEICRIFVEMGEISQIMLVEIST